MQSNSKNSRRGLSLVEVQLAAGGALMLLGILLSFTRFSQLTWHEAIAAGDAQQTSQGTMLRLAPTIRAARSVVGSSSGANRVTLQLPAYDGGGSLVLPMQDGEVVSYYLSDATGSPNAVNGSILWRSINGEPDRFWSMSSNRGRVIVKPSGLLFTYYPSVAATETVTVTITGAGSSGSRKTEITTVQEIVLRNRGL